MGTSLSLTEVLEARPLSQYMTCQASWQVSPYCLEGIEKLLSETEGKGTNKHLLSPYSVPVKLLGT